MSKIKKSDAKAYNNLFAKVQTIKNERAKFTQYTEGRTQAIVEQTYGDTWENDNGKGNYYVLELKILKGPDLNRTIKKKIYMPKNPTSPTEKELENLGKIKSELEAVGIQEFSSIENALESLEECVLEIDIWVPKNPNSYGNIVARPFLKRFISGPEQEAHQSSIEKDPEKGSEENPEIIKVPNTLDEEDPDFEY